MIQFQYEIRFHVADSLFVIITSISVLLDEEEIEKKDKKTRVCQNPTMPTARKDF